MVSNKFLTNKSYTIIGCDKDNIFHKGKQRVNTLHGGCFASTPLLSFFFLFSPIKCFASSLESRLWVDEGMVIVFPNSLRTIRLAGVFSEVDEHSNYVLWWSNSLLISFDSFKSGDRFLASTGLDLSWLEFMVDEGCSSFVLVPDLSLPITDSLN